MERTLRETLREVARFYDERKVGDVGALGFRRSTDLTTLLACLGHMLGEGIVRKDESLFLDLGCGDGRVNLFMGYMVKTSVGIETDGWTLEEYGPLRSELEQVLDKDGLLSPPGNVFLYEGDSKDESVYDRITRETGIGFDDFDLFYTYLVMHQEFAQLIAESAKKGAIFMVYGLHRILPQYEGLSLLSHISPLERILALYQKD
ncbi:MAG: hypothetical protein V1689_07270 [Pseudomonadota bacterium]